MWFGGAQPSQADAQILGEIGEQNVSSTDYPNLFAWWALTSKFTPEVRSKWPAAQVSQPVAPQKKEEKPLEKAPEKKADDDFDPFADEMDEEEKAQMERMKAKAAAAGKDKKKAVVAKSLIIWEVKPWGVETDLDALAKLILAITIDGLEWKTEYKKEPVCYGVFKIVIGAVVEDEKVSTDDVQERIEGFEEYVQSVDIVSFNKL